MYPSTNIWSGWQSLGGVLAFGPVVVRNADGRLLALVIGTDGRLYQNSQTAAGSRIWTGYTPM
jgi:hypothetical protein